MQHSAHQKVTQGRTDVFPTVTSRSVQLRGGLLQLLLRAVTSCAPSPSQRQFSTLTNNSASHQQQYAHYP